MKTEMAAGQARHDPESAATVGSESKGRAVLGMTSEATRFREPVLTGGKLPSSAEAYIDAAQPVYPFKRK